MKIIFQLATVLLCSAAGFSQTGIGTDNPNSNAALEVFSNTKGFLPPRVVLASTTLPSPLSAHVAGMVVYNTATAGSAPSNVTPGLYFNDGTSWKQFVTSIQKSSSYFGTLHVGDVGLGNGARSVDGFMLSADRVAGGGGYDFITVNHGLNLTGNQSINITGVSLPSSDPGANNQIATLNVFDVTPNSFGVYVSTVFNVTQNLDIMIQLTEY